MAFEMHKNKVPKMQSLPSQKLCCTARGLNYDLCKQKQSGTAAHRIYTYPPFSKYVNYCDGK